VRGQGGAAFQPGVGAVRGPNRVSPSDSRLEPGLILSRDQGRCRTSLPGQECREPQHRSGTRSQMAASSSRGRANTSALVSASAGAVRRWAGASPFLAVSDAAVAENLQHASVISTDEIAGGRLGAVHREGDAGPSRAARISIRSLSRCRNEVHSSGRRAGEAPPLPAGARAQPDGEAFAGGLSSRRRQNRRGEG
jgi:hypothetical protein